MYNETAEHEWVTSGIFSAFYIVSRKVSSYTTTALNTISGCDMELLEL